MKNSRVLVRALAVALLGLSGAAMAENSFREKPVPLNIPSQSIVGSLEALARQTGLSIMFKADLGEGIKSPTLNGEYSPDEALKRLLAESQLTYRFVDEKTVAIRVLRTTEIRTRTPAVQLAQSDASASSDASNGASTDEGKALQGGEDKLTEVVVTAQKRSERLQDVPISITVLSGKDLDQSTFTTAADALNTVPGVAAFQNAVNIGGTMIAIRGVSAGALYDGGASTTAYYVDSVPFGMIRSALVPDPDVYDLQQVEVLRGPQGTLYGANALNGVVRVLTFDPDLHNVDFKARSSVSTIDGGGENYDGDLAVNLPLIDGVLGVRAVVGEEHQGGWINDPVLGKNVNAGDIGNERLKVKLQPSDALSVDLSAWHSENSASAPPISDDDHQLSALHQEPQYFQFNAYGAKVAYTLSAVTLSSMTSYIVYGAMGVLDGAPAGAPNLTATTELDSRVISEEVNLNSNMLGPFSWSAGAMYRDDKDKETQFLTVYQDPTYLTAPTNQLEDNWEDISKSEAIYGELAYSFLSDTMKLAAGARYFRDENGTQAIGPVPDVTVPLNFFGMTSHATTPRVTLTWSPDPQLTGYATYSQGFRSGIPQDELTLAVAPEFRPLQPDKLTNYELGAKGSLWSGRVVYDIDVFSIRWHDIQQVLGVPNPEAPQSAVLVMINTGNASGQGMELSVNTQPVPRLTVGGTFSVNTLHLDSSIYSYGSLLFPAGSRPSGSPKYTAGMSAQYTFPLGVGGVDGKISTSANYTSPLENTYLTQGIVESNSILFERAEAGLEWQDHRWSTALFINNLSNWNGSQEPSNIPGWSFRAQPRTYGLRLDYHMR